MLQDMLKDEVRSDAAENDPPFTSDHDYRDYVARRKSLTEKWKKLTAEEKKQYQEKIQIFFRMEGLPDDKSSLLKKSKNLYLLRNEVDARIASTEKLKLLAVESLHHEASLIELLENAENANYLRELYRLRKATTKKSRDSGISITEAGRLKNCMRQGRELFLASKNGGLMVKPLNLFYALTAYAYPTIILNNPLRFSLDTLAGSHGLNYVPAGIKLQVGGDMPQGTFGDLFCSFPTFYIKAMGLELIQDNSHSLVDFFHTRHTASLGTLLSMVPEIREYYSLVTGRPSRTHPLEIKVGNNPRRLNWEFWIGDGETKPNQEGVNDAFKDFDVTERQGRYVAEIPAEDAHQVGPTVFVDAMNRLWYVENPFAPIVFPEICIHFLLTNGLSNIMRYSPDAWGEILLNTVDSHISLIIRKYLSECENKLPFLVLRSISDFLPYVAKQ